MREPTPEDKIKARLLFIAAKEAVEQEKLCCRKLDELQAKYLEDEEDLENVWSGFMDYICNEDTATFMSQKSLDGLVEELFSGPEDES